MADNTIITFTSQVNFKEQSMGQLECDSVLRFACLIYL